jgi:PRC-barrel domain
MSDPVDGARFKIGARVEARDGSCGELSGVIIDPVAQTLTHLLVTPKHHKGFGRLVPVDLVESDGDPIHLNCTVSQFLELDEGEEAHFLAPSDNKWGYPGGQVYAWPHYEVGLVGGMGAGAMEDPELARHGTPQPFPEDRVPVGEVEARRGDQVHAADGFIGSVEGLVVDPADHHVTHVLLAEGHLWGRKQVAIPIGTMTRRDQEIRVDLTKEQIEDLPPVELKSVP